MSKQEIHPQAVVAASAKLAPGVKVGAYAIVGEEVELGEGCVLHPHASVGGPARYGRNNVFHSFCVVGGDPQDYTFRGERTELVVGDGNIFRLGIAYVGITLHNRLFPLSERPSCRRIRPRVSSSPRWAPPGRMSMQVFPGANKNAILAERTHRG